MEMFEQVQRYYDSYVRNILRGTIGNWRNDYYEVKARPMNSGGSSSFWFHNDDTPNWLAEIDVFEIGGKAKGFEHFENLNKPPTNRGENSHHAHDP